MKIFYAEYIDHSLGSVLAKFKSFPLPPESSKATNVLRKLVSIRFRITILTFRCNRIYPQHLTYQMTPACFEALIPQLI
jgi:hypothetical protein